MFFLILPSLNVCKSLAVLINTSKNFFNYRHMVNTQVMHKYLTDNNVPHTNILSLACENLLEDKRNLASDYIHIDTEESIDISKFSIANLSEQYILNLFYLRHPFLMDLSENDSLFIYMCGHGCTSFFKVADKYYIFTDDMMDAIKYLSKRLKRVGIILDTCQASSLIYMNEIPENTFVITTSLDGEYSYSSRNVHSLGVSSIDEFTYAILKGGLKFDNSLKEAVSQIPKIYLKSTVSVYGNRDMSLKKLFFDNESQEVKGFVL